MGLGCDLVGAIFTVRFLHQEILGELVVLKVLDLLKGEQYCSKSSQTCTLYNVLQHLGSRCVQQNLQIYTSSLLPPLLIGREIS